MTDYAFLDKSGLDVLEDAFLSFAPSILNLLLQDKTTKKNILWATKDYEFLGDGYEEWSMIRPELITGEHATLIQPRTVKSKEEQNARTHSKAEVFTPSWVCNAQNNLVDNQWFGIDGVFNRETDQGWTVTTDKVPFQAKGQKTWKKYVDAKRLEITCGEAPYLASRYDSVTGKIIPINERIGILDRKLRVVTENVQDEADWFIWALRAFQSVYGYEYQGDSLLLARENLLATFIDYYQSLWSKWPSPAKLRRITNVISWNIWQMDGMKCVVPNSCKTQKYELISVFGTNMRQISCPGCKSGSIQRHTGIYCKVYDWRQDNSLTYISMMKGAQS